MPSTNVDPAELQQARDAGYSDNEIVNFLSSRAPQQFTQARDAGYTDGEILSHLSGTPNPPTRGLTINGHKVSVDDSFFRLSPEEQDATVDEIAKSLPAQPSGVVAGLQEGAANVVHGAAETAKQYLGMNTPGADATAQAIAPADYHGANIVPEGGHWYDPTSYNWSQVPQAIAEAAPGMATDIAAAKVLGRINPLLGVGAGVTSYLLRTRGDAAKHDAVSRTGNPEAQPETQDKIRSLATGAAESIPQAIGIGRFLPGAGKITSVGSQGVSQALAKALATSGVEAGTGAAQNAISQAGATIGTDKGLTIDPAQVAGAAVTGAATGGVMSAPSTLAAIRGAIKYRAFGDDNQNAASAFANRVTKAADGSRLNPANSFQAVRTADGAVRDELRTAVKPIKGSLDVDTADALKRATLGRVLTDSDLDNIDSNATPDVAFLARQAHVAAVLKDQGDFGGGKFIGGITNAVGKHLRVFNNPLGYGVGGAIGDQSLPHSPELLAALAGGYVGMRGIDALTGNRSPAKGFVNRFSDPSVAPRLPSSAPQALTGTPQPPTAATASPQAATPPAPMAPAAPAVPQPPVNVQALLQRLAPSATPTAPQAPQPTVAPQPAVPPVDTQVPRVVSPELLRRASVPQVAPPTDNPAKMAGMSAALQRVLSPGVDNGGGGQSQQRANPQTDSATVEEVPTPNTLLHAQVNSMDRAIASKATDDFRQAVPSVSELRAQRYFDSTAQRQARIRDRLMQISGHDNFPSEDLQLGADLDKLRSTRSREAVAAHIEALAKQYPQHARLIRSYFGPQWSKSVWNPTRN
jgi:hypothetical protein